MKYVFWQNVVSIHQSAFLKALSENNEVILVVQEKINDQRLSEGWSVPDMGLADVIVSPSEQEMKELINLNDCEHVFSGINAYPLVFKAFKYACKHNLSVSVIAEPYEWAGIKGILRRIMYSCLNIKYGSHIKKLLTTGNKGMLCYRKAGFPIEKIHQWGYFTDQTHGKNIGFYEHEKPNLIYIGRIDDNKNILNLCKSIIKLNLPINSFIIIGSGPKENDLQSIVGKCRMIKYVGTVKNEDIPLFLNDSDLLILPSLYDGWGAVVNEALSQGVRVLCSDACGASCVLDGHDRGGVFKASSQDDMESQLKAWVSRGVLSPSERKDIADWTANHLSGQAAARYFSDIMNGKNVQAPWLKEK